MKRTSIVLAVALFIFSASLVVNTASAVTTLNVYSNVINQAYYDNVVKAADRLILLQNENGSWDWDVTGATGPTSNTYLNITGVTAEGLLSAYSVTDNQTYLDGAVKAGDYIVVGIDASTPKSINSYNVLFLYKLSLASGVSSYADKASEYFGILYSDTPTTLCAEGCVNSAGIMAGQKVIRTWAGDPNGVVLWDLAPFVEYANLVGNIAAAQELADLIIAESNLETYVSTVTNYDLGLASALKVSTLVNDEVNKALISGKITSEDVSYGTSSEGKIQTTSYMVRAFLSASDPRANASASYISTSALTTGGWVDTDGSEYAEADSEAITALVSMLPQVVQFYSIQDAVSAAASGDVVSVNAGTYSENLNVGVPVTLQSISGAGGTTISGTGTSVITIDSDGVTINGFTITNGGTHGMGIYSVDKSNLTITNNVVTNIGNSNDDVMGRGIVIVSSASPVDSVNISNNQINNITSGMRTGTASVSSSGVSIGWSNGTENITNLVLDENTISNIGANTSPWNSLGTKDQGANGIIINHASGKNGNSGETVSPQITNNTISNLEGLWAHAIGLEGNTPNAVVTGNTISAIVDHKGGTDDVGILFQDNPSGGTVDISENFFNGGDFLGVAIHPDDSTEGTNAYGYVVDAANNWWGSSSPNFESLVSGNVTYTPWCFNITCTTFTSGPEVTTEITTPVETVITTDAGTVEVDIPAGTTVSGPSGWDGVVDPATVISDVSTVTVTADAGNTATVSLAIDVGSGDVALTLDKAARLLFPDQAGKLVGWSRDGVFTKITNACSLDDQATMDAELVGEKVDCYITAGDDLIVWTKHFTIFLTYTQTVIPTPPTNNGGGRSGDRSRPATPAVPGVSPAIPSPNALGRVLGAGTFNFGRDLNLGVQGDDVTELQNRLTNEGVYSGPSTGYFGPLTLGAVKAYQNKVGVSNTGYVGPLTRAQLNKSAVLGAETTNPEVLAQIAAVKVQIANLIQQLIEMLQAEVQAQQ